LRKAAAISLILLMLFNLLGYRMVVFYLQSAAERHLAERIDDNNYEESQLIEIRVPLNMPYQERYTAFERHYGELSLDGKTYTYVKRKIEGNILVLKCIANEIRQELKNLNDQQVRNNIGQDQHPGKKQNSSSSKSLNLDFESKNYLAGLSLPAVIKDPFSFTYTSQLNDVLISTPHQPPWSA